MHFKKHVKSKNSDLLNETFCKITVNLVILNLVTLFFNQMLSSYSGGTEAFFGNSNIREIFNKSLV